MNTQRCLRMTSEVYKCLNQYPGMSKMSRGVCECLRKSISVWRHHSVPWEFDLFSVKKSSCPCMAVGKSFGPGYLISHRSLRPVYYISSPV